MSNKCDAKMIIKNHLDKRQKKTLSLQKSIIIVGKLLMTALTIYFLKQEREAVAYAWPTMRSLVLLYIILTNLK